MPDAGIKDVAALAGVAVSTVSNVLNRPERVSPAVSARVRDAIDKLGFVRNDAARQLRAGRSNTIGMVVINISNPFFAQIAIGAEAEADTTGMSIILGNSEDRVAKQGAYLQLFERQRVDGVLISPLDDIAVDLDRLRRRGIPAVLVDHVGDVRWNSSVSCDDVAGGRMATEHLLALGRRKIAFYGARNEVQQMRDRLEGCRHAVDAVPGASLKIEYTSTLNPQLGREIGEQLLQTPADELPDAIFAANDHLALGILQSLMGTHIRVPEDIAIVGYDDIEFAAAASVPLSSVRQPSFEIGRKAAELLIREVEDPQNVHRERIMYTPELIVRASSQAGS